MIGARPGRLQFRLSRIHLEQRINERRQPGAREENQQSEDEENHDEWHEPPFLVLLHEPPKIGEKAGLPRLRSGLLKFRFSWFALHASEAGLWRVEGPK